MKYYVGCPGWMHSSWTDFYPSTLEVNDYLAYYSRVFNFVEIDLDNTQQTRHKYWDQGNSNALNIKIDHNNHGNNHRDKVFDDYYASSILPTKKIIEKWSQDTPRDFRFTLTLPGTFTNKIDEIGSILDRISPLGNKILAIRIQQNMLTLKNGREWLEKLLNNFTYHGYSAALEFDHYSWYQDLTYQILKNHNAALIWSDTMGHSKRYYYPAVTANFIYLRINENEKKWIDKIKEQDVAQRRLNRYGKPERKLESIHDHSVEEGPEIAVVVVDNPFKVKKVLNLLSLPQKKYGRSQWAGRIILCVDLNAFFPSCEELRDPSLIGKPHAVIMTDQNKDNISNGAVASCSYEARRFGVRSAMSLSRAKELCHSLILNPVDMQYYKEISNKVMRILDGYSDLLEQSSVDEAYLDCTRKINYNQSLTIEDYVLQIKKTLREQCGLLTSVGVASTKSVAKIASDFQKPDGLTIVSPDNLSRFLENLSVGAISGVGTKTQHVLREEFRVETIGQLAKQNVQRLIDRFGRRHGLWMWQVANGRDLEAVAPREDNISISSEQTIYPHTKDKERLLEYINELAKEVHDSISRKGYEFRTVGLKIVRSDFSIETRERSYTNYQNKQESIINVAEGLLDRFSFLLSEENTSTNVNVLTVRKIGIKLSNLIRIHRKKPPEQKTLLDFL